MNMALRFSGFGWVCVVLGISLLAGCGSKGPETVRVTGSVTLDGQPVEGATVAFFPEDGGRPARGVTDASGNFILMTFAAGDGALLGNHRVSVSKSEVIAAPPAKGAEEHPDTPTDGGAAHNVKHLLPVQYSSPTTSQLAAEVKRGMEPVVLELKSN